MFVLEWNQLRMLCLLGLLTPTNGLPPQSNLRQLLLQISGWQIHLRLLSQAILENLISQPVRDEY